MNCETVTRALSDGDGRVSRRRDLRAHLRSCPSCRRFGEEIEARQRDLAALSPLPALAAAGLLQGLLGGGGGAGGGGLAAAVGGDDGQIGRRLGGAEGRGDRRGRGGDRRRRGGPRRPDRRGAAGERGIGSDRGAAAGGRRPRGREFRSGFGLGRGRRGGHPRRRRRRDLGRIPGGRGARRRCLRGR